MDALALTVSFPTLLRNSWCTSCRLLRQWAHSYPKLMLLSRCSAKERPADPGPASPARTYMSTLGSFGATIEWAGGQLGFLAFHFSHGIFMLFLNCCCSNFALPVIALDFWLTSTIEWLLWREGSFLGFLLLFVLLMLLSSIQLFWRFSSNSVSCSSESMELIKLRCVSQPWLLVRTSFKPRRTVSWTKMSECSFHHQSLTSIGNVFWILLCWRPHGGSISVCLCQTIVVAISWRSQDS